MNDRLVCLYWLRGWQEWVEFPAAPNPAHLGPLTSGMVLSLKAVYEAVRIGDLPPVRNWLPAGTLAARVFRFPHVVKVGRWAHLPESVWQELAGDITDEQRLRQVFPALGPLSPHDRAALEIGRVGVNVTGRMSHLATMAPVSESAIPPNTFGPASAMFVLFDRTMFIVTAAEAVRLSAAAGIAQQTLGICGSRARDGGCARLFVAPRVGFRFKYCEDCRRLGRDTRARISRRGGSEALNPEKRRAWSSVSARMYQRVLRDEWHARDHKPAHGRLRRRKRQHISPTRQQEFEAWRLRAWNALRETDDIKAWEAQYAPKKRPGRPKGREAHKTSRSS